jgi:phosphatidylserine decarboxylase
MNRLWKEALIARDLDETMNARKTRCRRRLLEELNFAATNWLPRRTASRFMGWFSRIRHPLVRDLSIAGWRALSDLDLDDARKTRFESLHDCFVRELRHGARPIDLATDVLVSPCDAVIGACGALDGITALQAKGQRYPLADLLCDAALAEHYRDGCFATLRLKASMYHRFHAPHDCTVEHVLCVPGDAWNVNPPAVARVGRLYCRNERAVIRARLAENQRLVTLIPVAAVLVRSIRLHCLEDAPAPGHTDTREFACSADYRKGEEIGWFEHGSTLIVLAPAGYRLCPGIATGTTIRMGQRIMTTLELGAQP